MQVKQHLTKGGKQRCRAIEIQDKVRRNDPTPCSHHRFHARAKAVVKHVPQKHSLFISRSDAGVSGVSAGIFLAVNAPHSHPGISPCGRSISKTYKKHASFYQFPPPPLLSLSPATSKNTAAEELAAVNLSRLVGFLHLIAPTPALRACLTECSPSVLSDNIHTPHSAARVLALPTHSPPCRAKASVTEAPGCLGSGGQRGSPPPTGPLHEKLLLGPSVEKITAIWPALKLNLTPLG